MIIGHEAALPCAEHTVNRRAPVKYAGSRLGDFLRERSEQVGLLPSQIGHRLGVNQSSVSRWETNETLPSRRHARALAYILDLDPLLLLAWIDRLKDAKDNRVSLAFSMPTRHRHRQLRAL